MFGLERRHLASFEAPVRNLKGRWGKIDLLWPGVMIAEHKSRGQNLDHATTQAFQYIHGLQAEARHDEVPRYVIVSDFHRIVLYDLEPNPGEEVDASGISRLKITLNELPQHITRFAFMLGQTPQRLRPEDPANQRAYEKMAGLHEQLVRAGFSGLDLERFLVRILFCLFAEDTGIFEPFAFYNYITNRSREDGSDLGPLLEKLFQVLDCPPERRSKNLDDELAAFPYVNGRLFSDRLRMADFSPEMRGSLIEAARFYWAKISPAVFGSLFQGVLTREERRAKGAHYTSERDILKVCRGVFLDDLETEWSAARADRSTGRQNRLRSLHQKLASIRLFDPACGCGNFLVIAYRELRRLEHRLLKELLQGQQVFDISTEIKVNVEQAHGIELLEWPARIAEVALWLVDHQMNQEAAEAFGQYFIRLPLRQTPHILHENALRTDWRRHLAPSDNVIILGNPPFIGHQWRSEDQQHDMTLIFGHEGRFRRLDYVTAWYVLAARYMEDTAARAAFVATNSISQGEQVDTLWSLLYRMGIEIRFAHRSFPWRSDAPGAAHVHVVIIGFSRVKIERPRLYDYDAGGEEPVMIECGNISPYLIDGPRLTLPSRVEARPGHPSIGKGSQPTDGGHLIFTEEEAQDFLARSPGAAPYMRHYVGGQELISGEWRRCLWLKGISPARLRTLPHVRERLALVRASRLQSPTASVREYANKPAEFTQDRQPESDYLAVPEVSSERRRYIPIGYLSKDVIASNKLQIVLHGSLFLFGVLSSTLHVAWVKVVAGRLESRLSYSPSVLHNFPLPESITEAKRRAIETAAQRILAERERHLPPRGDSSLADLYDPDTMPADLLKAHSELDRLIDRLYRERPFDSDRERVEFLFKLYEKQAAPLTAMISPSANSEPHKRSSVRTNRAPPRKHGGGR